MPRFSTTTLAGNPPFKLQNLVYIYLLLRQDIIDIALYIRKPHLWPRIIYCPDARSAQFKPANQNIFEKLNADFYQVAGPIKGSGKDPKLIYPIPTLIQRSLFLLFKKKKQSSTRRVSNLWIYFMGHPHSAHDGWWMNKKVDGHDKYAYVVM